jgi:PleD family two-component response regulator
MRDGWLNVCDLQHGLCNVSRLPMSLAGTLVNARRTQVRFEENPVVRVVDDDESLRLSICELLEFVGFEAEGFGSTQPLMEADVLDRPGCIILDVRMPGLSGLEFNPDWPPPAFPHQSFS